MSDLKSRESRISDRVELTVDLSPGWTSGDGDRSLSCGDGIEEEEEPLVKTGECRICQDEDSLDHLETPCACRGSLKYAHRKCVQHWCNEKGNSMCEIFQQQFQPNYTAPPRPPQSEDTTIDIGGGWMISGTSLALEDSPLLAIAEAERHFLDNEYNEYASSNANGAAFCRSAALILVALLLLRHALVLPDDDDGEDDASAYFSLFLLRIVGFLLPCYIMAWAISILQHRRQRQAEAALSARQITFVLQSWRHRGVQFSIAPVSPVAAHEEPPV